MQLVIRTPHGTAEVAVEGGELDVTVGEILHSVVGHTPATVRVDGRPIPADTSLGSSGALCGSTLDLTEPDEVAHAVLVTLVQVAGPGAGSRIGLGEGSFRVGPSRRINAADLSEAPVDDPMIELQVGADGTVAVRPPAIETRLGDSPQQPGMNPPTEMWLDDTQVTSESPWNSGALIVGGRVFELRRGATTVASSRRFAGVGTDGTVAFNRPPRTASNTSVDPLVVPDGGNEVRDARRLPVIAMLAPLPIAIAMALLLGSPRFLLFGLMSPLMAGATWVSDRRQRSRELSESSAADTGAIGEFTTAAAARHRADRNGLADADLDVADIADICRDAAPSLWCRRPGDPDVFRVALGLGDVAWHPPLDRTNSSLSSADAILERLGPLRGAPVVADLATERGIGIVGRADFSRAMARGILLHACAAHGPADLDVVILTSNERLEHWEWAKWLPHVRIGGDVRILADHDQVHGWSRAVIHGWDAPVRPTAPSHLTLVVVDQPDWWRTRTAPLRPLFGDRTLPLRFIALTESGPDLPAVCTTVVTGEPGDTATIDHLVIAQSTGGVAPFLVDEGLALDVARHLAPLDDPDLPVSAESSLPGVVPIARLLELDTLDAPAIIDRWSPGRRAASPSVVAGVSERGPLTIDLVEDGPHALVAGTTGAGKSELLRSLVVGLAANLQPDEINFVLVDFKGGSAFDACAELPHTVGLVTDLDEHLAGRVLRSLRAELQHRELVLRDAGATSLVEYQRLDGVGALPRLVLVVDEFASVAAELPEFLPSLVDIAQRGRSLGLHMILATQRPAGVVDNKIKANTNLRIALRVQEDGDSLDVIGSRDAANLPRKIPGRAYARFAAGELTEFQSAYATGHSGADGANRAAVRPYVVGRPPTPIELRLERRSKIDRRTASDSTDLAAPTDLERLVDAIRTASDALGQSDQRRPATPPLREHLPLSELLAAHHGDGIPIGIVDLPDEQRQAPLWWEPGTGSSRIVYGIAGAGTSSLLVSLALGIAQRTSADDVHLTAIDADTNTLLPLAALPHCGAVVRLDEGERITRLAHALGIEVDRRKALAGRLGGPTQVVRSEPTVVLMIDNVGALRQMLDDDREREGTWQELERVIRDGQTLGISTILTAKHERAVPSAVATQIPERLVMRLGDQFAYAGFGLRSADLPTFVPGRAIRPDDGIELQLAEPPARLADHIASLELEPAVERLPLRVDPLPTFVLVDDVVEAASTTPDEIHAAIGLDLRTATPAVATIPFGESFFVTGPTRSGRSDLLVAIASSVARSSSDVRIFAVAPRRGPLTDAADLDDLVTEPADVAAWVDRIIATTQRRIVLVDDADRIAGPSFERLASNHDDRLAIVVAGRADSLRAMNHWSKPLQKFRHGALIRPTISDGELLRVSLGTRLPRFERHRGLLVVDGEVSPFLAASSGSPVDRQESTR